MSKKSRASFFSSSLISFHALYIFSMGIFAFFFTDIMLKSLTSNVTPELLAMTKYFGLMEIGLGFFIYEIVKVGKSRIRPLLYLFFISISSLYLMISRVVSNSLGDVYFYFRAFLILLLLIALINEIKSRV